MRYLARVCTLYALLVAACLRLFAADATAGKVPISFTLTKPGNVSLGVYDAQGQRQLRTLLAGVAYPAGTHSVAWDGLDRDGQPMAPGQYSWKLLQTNGLQAEYLLTVGTNPSNARWASWPGNHGGVGIVTVDASGMYLASGLSEIPPSSLKQSLDGKTRLWEHGQYEPWQGSTSLAVANGVLYQVQGNGKTQCIDPATGNMKVTWDTRWMEEKPEKDAKGNPVIVTIVPSDLDAAGDTVAVSYREKDTVRWLKPADGTVAREVQVPAPTAVAVAPSGAVYVISGDRLLAFAAGATTPSVLVAGLTAPGRISVEPSTGEILVVEGGASQQIKRFAANGKLVKTYGRKGGLRPQGKYDQPTSFLGVADIAADGRGGFVILEPESAPRRTTHINHAGRLVNEWYGGQQFFQGISPDPADPSIVWMDSHWGWLMQAKIDFKKKQWRVLATYSVGGMADGLIPGKGNSGVTWEARRRNGTLYLVRQGGLPCVLKVDERRHQLLPLVASSSNITHYWGEQPAIIREFLDNKQGTKYHSYLWTDGNGDGRPQKEEMLFSEWSAWWGGTTMDEDFNIYCTEGSKYQRMACTGWSAQGAPLYANFGKWETVVERPKTAPPLGGYSVDARAIFNDKQGNWYAIGNDGSDPHGWGWTGDMFSRNALMKWGADGQSRWVVGRHATSRPNPPGQFHNPVRIVGETHGCLVVAERVVQPAVVWDTDGLYVGSFLDKRTEDGLPKELYCWWQHPDGSNGSPLPEGAINYDSLSGGAMYTLPNGDVIWYAEGWNNNPIYRITGWDGWQRQQGKIAVATAPPASVAKGSGLSARYFDNRELQGEPVLTRIDKQVGFDWKEASPEKDKLPVDNFSVRWEGEVEAKFSEPYRFSAYANDGVRLWLDGKLIIDGWKDYDGQWHYHYTRNEHFTLYESAWIPLEAGKRYALKLEYYEGGKVKDNTEAWMRLNWESTTQDRQQLPQAFLYPLP